MGSHQSFCNGTGTFGTFRNLIMGFWWQMLPKHQFKALSLALCECLQPQSPWQTVEEPAPLSASTVRRHSQAGQLRTRLMLGFPGWGQCMVLPVSPKSSSHGCCCCKHLRIQPGQVEKAFPTSCSQSLQLLFLQKGAFHLPSLPCHPGKQKGTANICSFLLLHAGSFSALY